MSNTFPKSGYKIFRSAISCQMIASLIKEIESLRTEHSFTGGLRCLTHLSKTIADSLSKIPLQNLLDSIGLPNASLVRSILFDKTPEANWKVAWHQDTKIPIKEKIQKKGFTAWSSKNGIIHAQPPAAVLDDMRTLRIHLDDTPLDNGALRVVPGSHRNGFLKPAEIKELSPNEKTCECAAGDILAMSPLLLHASSPSQLFNPEQPQAYHRRVIHLEYANQPLPSPLEWAVA